MAFSAGMWPKYPWSRGCNSIRIWKIGDFGLGDFVIGDLGDFVPHLQPWHGDRLHLQSLVSTAKSARVVGGGEGKVATPWAVSTTASSSWKPSCSPPQARPG